MSDIIYLLWSNKHEAWWRPAGWGYTDSIEEAGDFSQAEAVDAVVRSAGCGDRNQVTLMVAAPHNWSPAPPKVEVVAGPGPLVDVLAEALPELAAQKRRLS